MNGKPLRRRSWYARGSVALFGGGLVFACWKPTDVQIDILTDLGCGSLHAGIYVRPQLDPNAAAEAESDVCVPRAGNDTSLGTLALVPNGDRDEPVVVFVVLTTNTKATRLSDCIVDPDDKSKVLPPTCIVARRKFKFLRHASRPLPIRLDSRCAGKRCFFDETCIDGECQSSDVDSPSFQQSTRSEDASVDTSTSLDAGVDGAPFDGGVFPRCTGPDGGGVLYSDGIGHTVLGGNTQSLFTSTGLVADGVVTRIHKNDGAASSFDTINNDVYSIAADDQTLWVGAKGTVARRPLLAVAGGTGWTFLETGVVVTDVALGSGEAFASIRGFDGELRLFTLPRTGADVEHPESRGGISIAAASTYVWSIRQPAASDPVLARNLLGDPAVKELGVLDAKLIATCRPGDPACDFPKDVWVTVNGTTPGIVRYSAEPLVEAKARFPVNAPLRIAVDAKTVYAVSGGSGNMSIVYAKTAAPDGTPMTNLVKDTYPNITALWVDDCVYFWTQNESGGVSRLRVLPKAP